MSDNEKKNPGWRAGENSGYRKNENKADILLARLDGVKRTGPDRWIARCPAHDDKRPSLADLAAGKQPSETDRERLLLAISRIEQALAAAGVNHV